MNVADLDIIEVLSNEQPPQPYYHRKCYQGTGYEVHTVIRLPGAETLLCAGCTQSLVAPKLLPREETLEQLTLF
jgi:hypothetical protein